MWQQIARVPIYGRSRDGCAHLWFDRAPAFLIGPDCVSNPDCRVNLGMAPIDRVNAAALFDARAKAPLSYGPYRRAIHMVVYVVMATGTAAARHLFIAVPFFFLYVFIIIPTWPECSPPCCVHTVYFIFSAFALRNGFFLFYSNTQRIDGAPCASTQMMPMRP